jgi:MerR family transcriptional regulator, copper efflux regulator
MNIGQAASASGVSAKMIRYYESIDLVKVAGRTTGGYRIYGQHDVEVLRFIHRARSLGFPVELIRRLLALWENPRRASAEVRAVAAQHVAELDVRIAELAEMRGTLAALVHQCAGDERSACPILEEMGRADVQKLDRRSVRCLKTGTT